MGSNPTMSKYFDFRWWKSKLPLIKILITDRKPDSYDHWGAIHTQPHQDGEGSNPDDVNFCCKYQKMNLLSLGILTQLFEKEYGKVVWKSSTTFPHYISTLLLKEQSDIKGRVWNSSTKWFSGSSFPITHGMKYQEKWRKDFISCKNNWVIFSTIHYE